MELTPAIAKMTLPRTTDPTVLAQVASFLGQGVISMRPKIPLPSSWVRACITDPKVNLELASWALRYCDDPSVHIAALTETPYPVTVVEVLAAAPYVTDDTRRSIVEWCLDNQKYELAAPLAKLIPEVYRKRLEAVLDASDASARYSLATFTNQGGEVLGQYLTDSDFATIFDRGVAVRSPEVLGAAVLAHYVRSATAAQLSRGLANHLTALITEGSTTPVEICLLLNDEERAKLLNKIISAATNDQLAREIDAPLTQLMIDTVYPPPSETLRSVIYSSRTYFTPDALDLMVAAPTESGWPFVAGHYALTQEQFEKVLGSVLDILPLNKQVTSRERLEQFVAALENTHQRLDKVYPMLLRYVKGSSDPLVERLYNASADRPKIEYLQGRWFFLRSKRLVPCASVLRAEVARGNALRLIDVVDPSCAPATLTNALYSAADHTDLLTSLAASRLVERFSSDTLPAKAETLIYAMADRTARQDYFQGKWRTKKAPVTPNLELFLSLVAAGTPPEVTITDVAGHHVGLDYQHAIIDYLPGQITPALGYTVLADYVWARLDASAPSTDIALDLLTRRSDEPLNTICDTLSRLAL
jgi:hypothetical protein